VIKNNQQKKKQIQKQNKQTNVASTSKLVGPKNKTKTNKR
jgi:hypothetical protein